MAAHNGDLLVARRSRTSITPFVSRPLERGHNKTNDVKAEDDFDVIGEHFIDFAAKLGC